METKILIDTNVLLDYLLTREPFYEDAMRIIHLCKDEDIKACIAAHSIPNMFFILRKDYSIKVTVLVLNSYEINMDTDSEGRRLCRPLLRCLKDNICG